MQSLLPLVTEPESALQSVIRRRLRDYEGENMTSNNRCGIMDTFSPHINVSCHEYLEWCGS